METMTKTKRSKLEGLNLKLISIHRQNLESGTPICCENCGKGILNFAKITDGNKNYNIGLDCKKTLIDKDKLKNLTSDDFMKQYEAKEYRKDLNEVNKFLLASSKENIRIDIDRFNSITITDNEKLNMFGTKGEIIYLNNLAFLQKHGLTDYINTLINNE